MISKYGYDTSNGILPFQAPLTQDQACVQVGGVPPLTTFHWMLGSDGHEAEHQGADVFLDRYQNGRTRGPRGRADENESWQLFSERGRVVFAASLWLAGCGSPSPAQNVTKSSSVAQAEDDECNVKEAARIVYGDPPPEQELNPEAEQALCEKAEILLAELEAIEEGQENPGALIPHRHWRRTTLRMTRWGSSASRKPMSNP